MELFADRFGFCCWKEADHSFGNIYQVVEFGDSRAGELVLSIFTVEVCCGDASEVNLSERA